ncbi:MAG: hypothetical protein BRD55_00900 [Bacteroidetes bacterium SW_9_63_38]|nr:MAG: hypothetical protein BRD55_00900 [Bacteroidetes bacterium SW_9_63_38]
MEPAIFGTLLERALDPRERHKLGAHFTPRAYVERLEDEFTAVAPNPRPLYNSQGNPTCLLCFAAGNPKGAPTAVDIANDILEP